MTDSMTSMERVLTALDHREPDRVPVALLLTMHGARELDLGLKEYFGSARNVVEGQLRLRRRYGHDCFYAITYAATEYEAFGGQTLWSDDGPVNAGRPVIRHRDQIFALEPPDVGAVPELQRGLEIIQGLAEAAAGEVPVLGAAVSPFSLPVMLMGFEAYLDLLHDDPEGVERLLQVTRRFFLDWARAQFAAGATALGYFDPLSADDITSEALFRRWALPTAQKVIPAAGGAMALHLASGRAGGRIDDYAGTGAAALGVSSMEEIGEIKKRCAGRIALIGNLNGVAMARWTPEEAAEAVRRCVQAAGPGGGLVLTDNHGEIPFQVPDEVLTAIMDAARRWGTYPISRGDT